jgi:citronellol/citronellal dehydrogenase
VSAAGTDEHGPPDGEGLLRAGLLDGVRVVVATAPGAVAGAGSAAVAVEARCTALGAALARCELTPGTEPAAEEELAGGVQGAVDRLGGADVLVVDAAALFAVADGEAALLASMQASWELTRAVAAAAMLEDGGGLVVLIAPAPRAGEHAEAARAGLENLARTLSIEWARFATRAVAVAAGDATAPRELAEVVAYLASPAGAYYSGCQLDLRGG